jgi:uncharacterized membrane protein
MRHLKAILRYTLAAFFILAGLNHFRDADFYLRIMPPYLPAHLAVVYVSGFSEIALGAILLWSRYQVLAAWGLIALTIAVFPANIHMALHAELYPEFSRAALWARLALQGALIAWVYWYTRPEARA